jgi:hypothetical protein
VCRPTQLTVRIKLPTARRAKSSPEIVAYCRSLELRWLKLARQAQETGGALGRESGPAATPDDKPATYPAEYGKRAGELIAATEEVSIFHFCERRRVAG